MAKHNNLFIYFKTLAFVIQKDYTNSILMKKNDLNISIYYHDHYM